MCQSIQPCRGQEGIAEEDGPLVRCPVAGQDDRALFMALVDLYI